MSNERLSGKPTPLSHTEKRWDQRVFVGQTPDLTAEPGLGKLSNPERDVDVSMEPGMIAGITSREIDAHLGSETLEEQFLPEGGFSIVGDRHFTQVERVNKAEQGY